MIYTSESILVQGKYKNVQLKDIPQTYLVELYRSCNCWNDEELKLYIRNVIPSVLFSTKSSEPSIDVILNFPCEKVCWVTEKAAKDEIKRIDKVKQKKRKPTRAYECDKCGGWHLTSQEKK